jgi:hypothetical protein
MSRNIVLVGALGDPHPAQLTRPRLEGEACWDYAAAERHPPCCQFADVAAGEAVRTLDRSYRQAFDAGDAADVAPLFLPEAGVATATFHFGWDIIDSSRSFPYLPASDPWPEGAGSGLDVLGFPRSRSGYARAQAEVSLVMRSADFGSS